MSRRTIPIEVKSKDLSRIGELLRGGVQSESFSPRLSVG
jgi:hypothetical protein